MKQKWGDDNPQFTRWDLSCLQASAVYYEGLEAPVVIAGGEDVLVRRPITADELAYTMHGAPCRRTHIRFGGTVCFAEAGRAAAGTRDRGLPRSCGVRSRRFQPNVWVMYRLLIARAGPQYM